MSVSSINLIIQMVQMSPVTARLICSKISIIVYLWGKYLGVFYLFFYFWSFYHIYHLIQDITLYRPVLYQNSSALGHIAWLMITRLVTHSRPPPAHSGSHWNPPPEVKYPSMLGSTSGNRLCSCPQGSWQSSQSTDVWRDSHTYHLRPGGNRGRFTN